MGLFSSRSHSRKRSRAPKARYSDCRGDCHCDCDAAECYNIALPTSVVPVSNTPNPKPTPVPTAAKPSTHDACTQSIEKIRQDYIILTHVFSEKLQTLAVLEQRIGQLEDREKESVRKSPKKKGKRRAVEGYGSYDSAEFVKLDFDRY